MIQNYGKTTNAEMKKWRMSIIVKWYLDLTFGENRVIDFSAKKNRRYWSMTMSKCVDIRTGEKYMLTIKEASVYFGIGIKQLRWMAENNDGSYSLKFGNRFMICRPRFEMYLNDLMSKETTFTENDQEE